jgi:hypothetical protein
MTVSNTTPRSGPYIGDGIAVAFAYDFPVFDEDHIEVTRTSAAGVKTVLVLNVDYTLTGVGDLGGGSVVLSDALAVGESLEAIPSPPLTQEVDLVNQGAFFAEVIERAFDYAALRDQNLSARVEDLEDYETVASAAAATATAAAASTAADLVAVEALVEAISETVFDTIAFAVAGDNTVGPYTLPAVIPTAGSIFLHVDGVAKRVNVDFTYAGATVTMAAPVAPTSVIHGWIAAGLAVAAVSPGAVNAASINSGEAAGIKSALGIRRRDVNDYGTVGDGITSDQVAVTAARTAAGEGGEVYYPEGTYRLTSRVGVPQGRGVGPGMLTDGTITWPADRTRRRKRAFALRTDDGVTIDATGYCHLPSGIEADDGAFVVPYYAGSNHGQADDQGVAKLHAAGTTVFTINGNEASGGQVSMGGQGSRVQIVCEGDETGKNFTVSGIVNGVADTEVVAGVNASSATTTKRFTLVSAAQSDAPTAGRVSIGLFTVPSDLKVALSDDGGQTWNKITLGDGRTGWAARFYECVIVKNADGRLIVLAQYWDMVGSVIYRRWISDDNGRTWSAPKAVTFSGFAFTGTPYIYGNPKLGKDGGIRIAAYDSAAAFVLTSYDDGATWTRSATIAHPGGGQTYTEPGLLMHDDDEWVLILRLNGTTSAFKQFRTFDGGASWAAQGDTNLIVSGAYASPEGQSFIGPLDGRVTDAALITARPTTSTAPSNPGTISVMTAKAEDVMTSPTRWSRPYQLVSFLPATWVDTTVYAADTYVYDTSSKGTYRALVAHTASAALNRPGSGASWQTYWEYLPIRSGYPSAMIDEHTGQGGFVWAKELTYRTSAVMFNRLNLNRYVSRANGETYAFNPILVGDGGGAANVMSLQVGEYSRVADIVRLSFGMTITTLNATGNLSIQPDVAGSIPKPATNRDLGHLEISTRVAGITAGYMKSAPGEEKFNLQHESSTAISLITAAELGAAPITIIGSIVYRTEEY